MTVALVQSKTTNAGGSTLAYDAATTAGNLLVCVFSERDSIGSPRVGPSGWTLLDEFGDAVSQPYSTSVWYKVADGTETSVTITGPTNHTRQTLVEFSGVGTPTHHVMRTGEGPSDLGNVGAAVLGGPGIYFGVVRGVDSGGVPTFTTDPAYTLISSGTCDGGFEPVVLVAYKIVGAAGSQTFWPTSNRSVRWGGLNAALEEVVSFTANFSASPTSGDHPLAVAFTDESGGGTGTPDSWAWDFGDGTTSTEQDPMHVYTVAGNYTVTLIAGTDDAETDTETKVAYITVTTAYVPPPPGAAIVEIYAASPGSYRWGIALWGVGTWSSAGWQDVTPQSVVASVKWGAASGDSGILTQTEAASWRLDTYDPDRLLDPGNEDSPYHADLRAGLPIRIRHRGTVIRQGIAETIAFYYRDDKGAIRATDNVSRLARAPVPSDSVLADTLRARARDAIAAAGLVVTVEPDPPSGDPALAPRLTGDRNVWAHIADAAEQTLNVAYVDRIGTLRFRPWNSPYERGRSVTETNLVDLGTIVQTTGLYSVVQVRNLVGEGDDIIERALTPTPRYGKVTYLRNAATPDSDTWADTVLADRALQTVQWVPGAIYPLTADDVEYFATLEAVERIGVEHSNTSPIVNVSGIIVGGEFEVTGKKDSEAVWGFSLELAQTATVPLIVDGSDPPEYLLHELGDDYLYPG